MKLKAVHKVLHIILCILCVFIAAYSIFVFSPNATISKWRDIYIETAMNTFNHQWLATSFIPSYIIDDTMARSNAKLAENQVDASDPPPIFSPSPTSPAVTDAPSITEPPIEPTEPPAPTNGLDYLNYIFPDLIDLTTVPTELEADINCDFVLKDAESYGIQTVQGDPVWGIDCPNQLVITIVRGSNYEGKLAIVKNPSAVIMAADDGKDWRGETVLEFCEANDGILCINANGFWDPEGNGSGALSALIGTLICDGVTYKQPEGAGGMQIGGFDYDDNFLVGTNITTPLRDASESMPAIIVNGVDMIDDYTYWMGIQPRTVVGQTTNKTVLLLIIDGRQIGYSIGASMADCVEILSRYDCWTALAMDGGSSSAMAYDGELITRPSTSMIHGRYLPCAWVVKKN